MRSFFEIIKAVESSYPVSNIYYGQFQIWGFLRGKYWTAFQKKELGFDRRKFNTLGGKIRLLGCVFYGWKNLFRKYTFIAFSHSSYRRIKQGFYYDRFIDPVIEEIGKDDVLLFELTNSKHYNREINATEHVISDLLIRVISYFLSKIPFNFRLLKCGKILSDIEEDFEVYVNYKKYMHEFIASYYLRLLLFKIYKPSAVFVVCYSSFVDVVYAARKMGIPVIEIQHGVIGKNHPTYNFDIELDNNFSPDFLLSFGTNEVNALQDSKFIATNNIVPVGNSYIEFTLNSMGKYNGLEKWKKAYMKCIGFTGQDIFEADSLLFLKEAAIIDPSIGYIYIPRDHETTTFLSCDLPDNVCIFDSLNFYEIIGNMDFHVTVCSTCALEAPSLGVRNILVDLNGFSRKYYEEVLTDREVSSFVDTPSELVEIVSKTQVMDRDQIIKRNNYFFLQGYDVNISKFLSEKILNNLKESDVN